MSKDQLLSLIMDMENNFNQVVSCLAMFGFVTDVNVRELAENMQKKIDISREIEDLRELIKEIK